ncbi:MULTISPECIES: ABC transporter ATP-binding protein [Actinomadura]|uniref:ATP-binding cassette domain-containing protein n=1 Tax=Actinomadura litoris TaxID=2678616 RepID=A0A7K1KWK0_9ACTN|nr:MULTISPECIES: ABC transporter ATP-binding protein [Actinomadura]MBT2211522.1 ABC transporter ATP-binding protein/permease [Actinomadura sp. NEAU-AAG7]MUN36437.1 ATP-binding cassette domain-containing protein [Actinomadura litoris]
MTSPTTAGADRLLVGAARHSGGWTGLVAATAVADALAAVLLPLALARAVDAAPPGGPSAASALWPCVALVLLSATAEVLSELATGCSAARATAWLRHALVRHVLAVGPALRVPPGDVAGRTVGGAAEAGTAPSAAPEAAVALLPPLGALTVLAFIDWRLAVAVAVALPAIVLLLRVFVRDITASAHRYLSVQGTIAGRLAEALAGARTIAAAGTAEREAERVLRPLPGLRAEGETMWTVQGGVAARGLLTLLLLQVAAVGAAGAELMAGRVTAGELVATVQYAGLAAGFGPVLTHVLRLGRARAGARRAAEILEQPAPADGDAAVPEGRGTLEFRGVSAGGVLHGLDLTVPGGLAVAVVGRSGAGKSLLAALAGRLADPDRGEVLLDGAPLPRLARTELRRHVGYAFARPTLFGETVLDAIAFGPCRPPESWLRESARTACADDFVRRLPQGYATPLADAPMSGGELQRMGLARAFAHAGRVLVLDDATSSLDTVTEVQVTGAVLDRFGDRTRLIIAHRAGTAARADLVVWLDGGRVRGRGTHAELWRDPAYRAVFGVAEPAGAAP